VAEDVRSSEWACRRARAPIIVGLQLIHARVQPAHRDELLVPAALDDAALVEDDDAVRIADGGEAVRDDERRAPLLEVAETVEDEVFGLDRASLRRAKGENWTGKARAGRITGVTSPPKSLEALVRRKVDEGLYSTEEEVVGDALRLMQARDEASQIKRARLQDAIERGYADIAAGRVTRLENDDQVDAFFAEL